jgi:hypothetical protein
MSSVGSASPQTGAEVVRLERRARSGVWVLVLYGLLLSLSTLTHQPDPATDFAGYADYVTTPTFLVSHLVASIAGAGLGILGAIALAIVAHACAPRQAEIGLVAWTLGQCGVVAVFGVAAFAQPALGRAFLGGAERTARSLESDIYGTPLLVTAGLGLLLFITGAVLLARAVHHLNGVPPWATHVLWGSTAIFVVSGFTFSVVQPVAGLAFAAASAVIAMGLRPTSARSEPDGGHA